MSTSVTANRIYQRGKVVAEDLQELAPDLVLLRGCKPPKESSGGLALPGAMDDHPIRACVAFEVVKLPVEMTRGNPMSLKVGDVVSCRNAMVDPYFGNELALTDLYTGVVGVVERAS